MIEMDIKRFYELKPNDSHKSFYGKAVVAELENGGKVLFSYGTMVLYESEYGELFKVPYNFINMHGCRTDYSATTQRHIKAYCGLNTAEYRKLPAYY